MKVVDPNIKRKKGIVTSSLKYIDGTDIPLPSVVEISESGTCNRVCAFCPRSDPDYPDEKKFIPLALLEKLINELASYNYSGIFLFSGFVEPLLDKKIYKLVNIASQKMPNAKIEMVTNGDVLNKARLKKLFDSGLSTLLISAYDDKEQADGFRKLCQDVGLDPSQYVVRDRYLPPEDDFGITLSNRSGLLKNAEFKIDIPDEPLDVPCYYPHYTFFMDYLGDVLLCPHDWGKKMIVGNLNHMSFYDIWTSKKLMIMRKQLGCGNRRASPCAECDVKGVLMGKEHYQEWEKLTHEQELLTT